MIKEAITSLDIIRIGTSGAIQPEIPVDSFLVSEVGIGMDGMLILMTAGISRTST